MATLNATMPAGFALLSGRSLPLGGQGWASDYAAHLLHSLGLQVQRCQGIPDPTPAQAWLDSGLLALTGAPNRAPVLLPLPLPSCIDGVRQALLALLQTVDHHCSRLPGMATLSERAALLGYSRQGQRSAGGACRFLRCQDGWLALSLARPEDWEMLAAWLEIDLAITVADEAGWQMLARRLSDRHCADLLPRGRLLGLALAQVDAPDSLQQPADWLRVTQPPPPLPSPLTCWRPPLVIELASLWAGPLCGHLLQQLGARVIKVESLQRPDGARRGHPAFFDSMHGGKESVALDFQSPQAIRQLQQLLTHADIVIEGSRPRALRQLGIEAEVLLEHRPGLTWLSITGHGRTAETENWIAYGDDAGVAAGLSSLLLELTGEPAFCGDAIADPLTGWHAALAGLAGFLAGGGGLLSLALTDVVRHCAQFQRPDTQAQRRLRQAEWSQQLAGRPAELPPARRSMLRAPALGADTAAMRKEFRL